MLLVLSPVAAYKQGMYDISEERTPAVLHPLFSLRHPGSLSQQTTISPEGNYELDHGDQRYIVTLLLLIVLHLPSDNP